MEHISTLTTARFSLFLPVFHSVTQEQPGFLEDTRLPVLLAEASLSTGNLNHCQTVREGKSFQAGSTSSIKPTESLTTVTHHRTVQTSFCSSLATDVFLISSRLS